MAETAPTLTIAPVDGNNVINAAEAAAGVALTGTVSGLAAGSTFNVTVTDNGVTKTYVATVNAGRHRLERDDPRERCDRTGQRHRDGVGAGDRYQRQPVDLASQSVTVAESGPTLTITPVDGNNSSTLPRPMPPAACR